MMYTPGYSEEIPGRWALFLLGPLRDLVVSILKFPLA